MDLTQLIVTLLIPVLISLVAYLGHRSIQNIDEEIKTLKKTTANIRDNQSRIERLIEISHQDHKTNILATQEKIRDFKEDVIRIQTELSQERSKLTQNTEVQGKILMILNKVVTEVKRQKP